MSALQMIPLGSVTTWLSGGTPDRSNPVYWGGDIPWISAASLKKTRISDSDQKLTEAGLRRGSRLAPEGATLVLVRGMALHRELRVGMATRPVSFNQDVKALVPHSGVLPEFLVFSLQARRTQILDLVSSAGSGTGVLDTGLLKRLPIWVPSRAEQRMAVEALEDAEKAIDAVERMISKQLAVKQGLLQKLLAGKGGLSDWRRSRLSDLIEGLEAGVSVRSSEQASRGIAVLKTSAISGGRFDPAEAKHVIPQDVGRVRCNPVAGSVIISRMNTPNLVGEVGYVESDYPNLYLPDRLWLARPKRGKDRQANMRWLVYYLSSEYGSRAVRGLATGTSGSMKNIPKDKLLALEVPTPPPHEQDEIANTVHAVDCAIDLLRERLVKARNVKQGMMQQLLTGRVHLRAKEIAA